MTPRSPAPASAAGALDVFVELLSSLDADGDARQFHNRLCEALCRLTSMDRAILFLYARDRELVVLAGSHGVPPELEELYGTLEETPAALSALTQDRVIQVDELEQAIPARYAQLTDLSRLACVPVAAGGRWLGVIFADAGGADFTLTDTECEAMWMLGKTAALAASAQRATVQHEHSRRLSDRIRLARDVHERVVQRLFGVSMVLGAEGDLEADERARCRQEVHTALHDLRDAMAQPLAPESPRPQVTLAEQLTRLAAAYPGLRFEIDPQAGELPGDLQALAAAVLIEAVRNASKHAQPSAVAISYRTDDGTFVLEVTNDGVDPDAATRSPEARPPSGMGLRLAALEAVHRGGVLEFGPQDGRRWRVRLLLPVAEEHG